MPLVFFIDKLCHYVTRFCGVVACCAMIALLLNVFYDVIMRYVFNDVSIGMQELEWHLFAVTFLFGTPYAMARDGHVRVDIFYESWTDRTKAWVNLFGALIFTLPFVVVVSWYGVDFSYQAYSINEGSGDPGGLPHRWLIKSAIPLSFACMGVAALGMCSMALRVLINGESYPKTMKEGLS